MRGCLKGEKKGANRHLFLCFWESLFRAQYAETLLEAVNAATGINDTLLTSVEWVAFVTNIQVDVFT
ncbi:hypothetical protein A8L45_12990 [Veronia pacifica]|uniref:Uncharacterized protein n=1 Tax=Veronia pacifica TaxID=1080227 RepID=A0A1C3EGM4_9GAMM|nr:hypothetical protein A8L45_12990 [Veronia pacifica]